MRQAFSVIDDALIEGVFQPIANLASDLMGLDRFRMASTCLEVSAAAWVLSQGSVLSAAVLGWNAAPAFLHLALLLLGMTALLGLQRVLRRVPRQRANPLRPAMRQHRAVALLLLLTQLAGVDAPGMAEAADLVMLGLVTAALYLGACAERPPVRPTFCALPQAT